MSIKLVFGHNDNGDATANMVIDDGERLDFDYVELVKHLYEQPDESLTVEIDDTYSTSQKKRLEDMVDKIGKAAKERQEDPSETSAE